MSIVQEAQRLRQHFQDMVGQLDAFIQDAAHDGKAVHQVEKGLWQRLVRLGRHCLAHFVALAGDGDQGEAVPSGDPDRPWQRLPQRHPRRYQSIFGTFELQRAAYGSREGQKIEFVPLDNRLQLPAGAYSYLLQDWSQGLCVESAFGQVSATLLRIFELKVSADGLERINEQMARPVADYRLNRPRPAADAEGELFVASGDGKGVVMRRSADEPAPAAHRTKGEKASRKRMAMVASVYSVDRHVRTAQEVVAALFREPRPEGEGPPARPQPRNKRVMASLARADAAGGPAAVDVTHEWMLNELVERNREGGRWQRPRVFLDDGQESLWEARGEYLPAGGIDILDLLYGSGACGSWRAGWRG